MTRSFGKKLDQMKIGPVVVAAVYLGLVAMFCLIGTIIFEMSRGAGARPIVAAGITVAFFLVFLADPTAHLVGVVGAVWGWFKQRCHPRTS